VFIKEPTDDNALNSFCRTLLSIAEPSQNCVANSHETLTVLYFSSYLFTPSALNLLCNGRRFWDVVKHTIRNSPSSVACIVRTVTPQYFTRSLSTSQRTALDVIRKNCYVRVYDKNRPDEFLNHAKYFVGFHFCFSEQIYYHALYYGSTNFTVAGLSHLNSTTNTGNYEEFYAGKLQIKRLKDFIDRKRSKEKFYLREIMEIIRDTLNLQNPKYLKEYVYQQKNRILTLVIRVEEAISHTPKALLYKSFLDSQIFYLRTIAFISDLPGKKQTQTILEKLAKNVETPDPFEVEALMALDDETAEKMAKALELSDDRLKELAQKYLGATKDALKLLETYNTDAIISNFDQPEQEFYELLGKGECMKTHLAKLEKLLNKRW
jgi:hypothetical protein